MRKLEWFLSVMLLSALSFASAARAETPCDFKGVSVGNKMTAAQIMTAFGVENYKTNPQRPSFEATMELGKKYSMMVASEMEDWDIGPYCTDTSCEIPYGVVVGDGIPVWVSISFDVNHITAIDVIFSLLNWNQMLPIIDQKYGPDWNIKRENSTITDYETKKSTIQEGILLEHISNGTNPGTKDHCEIWANNIDIVFEHHDALGPYHSVFEIKLISKNF